MALKKTIGGQKIQVGHSDPSRCTGRHPLGPQERRVHGCAEDVDRAAGRTPAVCGGGGSGGDGSKKS